MVPPNDETPVPPYDTDRVEVAETIPAVACKGPLNEVAKVRPPVTDSPVVEA